MYGSVDVQIQVSSTSVLVGGWRWASHACRFIPKERDRSSHRIGNRVGPRAGLDSVKWQLLTLPGLVQRFLACPAHSQSLYRLILVYLHMWCLHSPGWPEKNYQNHDQDRCFPEGVQHRVLWNESLKRYCWANPLHKYLELAWSRVTAIQFRGW
jgi:hypothetical protein